MRDEADDDDEGRGGPGWFATLLGAALLLAAGFAVGVVVGAVREEPAMLLRYVAGKGAALPAPPAPPVLASQPEPAQAAPPAAPAARVAPAPAAAAAPPRAGEAAAPAAQETPAPAGAPAAAAPGRPAPEAAPRRAGPAAAVTPQSVASAPAARTRFAVQVGAFAQSAEAEKLEAELRRKGLPVYVQPATGARDSRWRVRVGPLATRDEADRVAARLKTQDKLPVWVLEESG